MVDGTKLKKRASISGIVECAIRVTGCERYYALLQQCSTKKRPLMHTPASTRRPSLYFAREKKRHRIPPEPFNFLCCVLCDLPVKAPASVCELPNSRLPQVVPTNNNRLFCWNAQLDLLIDANHSNQNFGHY